MSEGKESSKPFESPLSGVKNVYDFSFMMNYPQAVSEAMSRLDTSQMMNPIKETMQKVNMAKAFGQIQQQAFNPTRNINELYARIGTINATLTNGFRVYAAAMKRALPSIDFEKIDQKYIIDPLNRLAMDYGWPPLYLMPIGNPRFLFEEASRIKDGEQRQQYIDEQITVFYREELDSLISNWETQEYLKDTERLEIIRDGFEAYKEGKYSLSSPAILAQTEGVFLEHIEGGLPKTINIKHYQKHIRILKRKKDVGKLTIGLGDMLFKFVEAHGLFGSQAPTNPISQDISRNSILHGSSTVYCKREDISLRHLLWLDCVIRLINALKSIEN